MESLSHILPWAQIILSVLLISSILLQRSGAELGGTFGGGDGSSGTSFARRGAEKGIFYAAIVISILFVLANFATLLVR